LNAQELEKQKELSTKDYMHDPDNPPRPLLKRRTVGLEELTAAAAKQPASAPVPGRQNPAARRGLLLNETPQDKQQREEVQVVPFTEDRCIKRTAGICVMQCVGRQACAPTYL